VFSEVLRPYFREEVRVLRDGMTFMANGVQMHVFACDPPSGIVTSDTNLYTNGHPLYDITRCHLLPIYETLPNRDKDLDAEGRFEKYLRPYFAGSFRRIFKGMCCVLLLLLTVMFRVMWLSSVAFLLFSYSFHLFSSLYRHGAVDRRSGLEGGQL